MHARIFPLLHPHPSADGHSTTRSDTKPFTLGTFPTTFALYLTRYLHTVITIAVQYTGALEGRRDLKLQSRCK